MWRHAGQTHGGSTEDAAPPTPLPGRSAPRDRLLAHLAELGLRLLPQRLDELLTQAEQQGWSHLELLAQVLAVPANERRERALARRLAGAKFRDGAVTLEHLDWQFNPALDRVQLEALATGDFVRRQDNLIFIGQQSRF